MLKISVFYLDKKYGVYQVFRFRIVLFSTNRWALDVLTFLIHGFEKTHAKSLWCITWPDSATLLCTLDLSFMNLYPLLAKKCFKSCIKKLFSVLFKLKGQGQHNGLKSILNHLQLREYLKDLQYRLHLKIW